MPFHDWLANDNKPSITRWAGAIEVHEKQISKFAEIGYPDLLSTRPILKEDGRRQNSAYVWTKEQGVQDFSFKVEFTR